MKKGYQFIILFFVLTIPMYFMSRMTNFSETYKLFVIIISILSFFTILIPFLKNKGVKLAGELWSRTLTFWWITAFFFWPSH